MPVYEYKCEGCPEGQNTFQISGNPNDYDPQVLCSLCGKMARRIYTPPSIVFKGTGWYTVDSRKK